MNQVNDLILADDMGLGKTVEAVVAIESKEDYPCLIVCPKAVKVSWMETFRWIAPDRTVVVVESSKKVRQFRESADADVVIVNWDILRTSSRIAPYGSIRLSDKDKETGPLNRDWACVVADEAHKAKDPKSKQTRALWAVRSSSNRAIALTGTPVANDPRDFWSLLHFIRPDEWPARNSFIDRYCLVAQDYWGGIDILGLRPETRDEFHQVTGPRFLRRLKDSVAKDLPAKQYSVRYAEMGAAQGRAYRQMVESWVAECAEAEDGVIAAFDPLSVNTRLIQFASASAKVEDDGKVKLSMPSNKIEALLEFAEETNEPFIVFSVSRQLIDLAADSLGKNNITYGRITGAESEAQRAEAKRAFLAGESRIMLLTMGAGGTGLDGLQAVASTAVFLQRSYSYVENSQAEDRLHRIGQADTVNIVDIITPGTVEETLVLPAIQRKKDMVNEVTRDREALKQIYGR